MIARVITAMSASLIVVLALILAPKFVKHSQRGRAIALIYMGVSSALVLGVPIGIVLTNLLGWRTVFLGIALLTIVTSLLIYFFIEQVPAQHVHPLLTQLKALGNVKMLGAHLATLFMLAGHYTVYAYFAPFLQMTLNLSQYWISIFYFLFGIAAVSGGALGGLLTERFGAKRSLLFVIGSFAVVLFTLPYATFSVVFFIVIMMIWGAFSWAISSPQQVYIIDSDPPMAPIHQSLNNSAIQFGIALGSGIGGGVIHYTNSVINTTAVGAGVVILALFCAIFSLTQPIYSAEQKV